MARLESETLVVPFVTNLDVDLEAEYHDDYVGQSIFIAKRFQHDYLLDMEG